jgi:hypothetical protein
MVNVYSVNTNAHDFVLFCNMRMNLIIVENIIVDGQYLNMNKKILCY